ncbi:MAG: ComF family protein [Caldithrix sp.]|nr:ComF family protein [Caldithrix sp.]
MVHYKIRDLINAFMIEPVMDLLLPAQCVICTSALSTSEKAVCKTCLDALPLIEQPQINALKDEIEPAYFDYLHLVYQFSEEFQKLAHYLKYKRFKVIAGYFADKLADVLYANGSIPYDVITAVPLHPVRLRERGYNQSALIAANLSTVLNIPFDDSIIQRIKNTQSQTQLNRAQRVKNVTDAFAVKKTGSNSSILLVDDVITTGSTLNACALSLKNEGYDVVGVAAMATPVDFLQNSLEENTSKLERF